MAREVERRNTNASILKSGAPTNVTRIAVEAYREHRIAPVHIPVDRDGVVP